MIRDCSPPVLELQKAQAYRSRHFEWNEGVPPMKKDHDVHKYQRVRLGKKYIVYKCSLPNCAHFIRQELVVGRKSLCCRCGKEFLMTQKSLLKKPHCEECTRRNKKGKGSERTSATTIGYGELSATKMYCSYCDALSLVKSHFDVEKERVIELRCGHTIVEKIR